MSPSDLGAVVLDRYGFLQAETFDRRGAVDYTHIEVGLALSAVLVDRGSGALISVLSLASVVGVSCCRCIFPCIFGMSFCRCSFS